MRTGKVLVELFVSHLTTRTPDGPATGVDAAVISTPHARDEVETKLEPTGKEVLCKIVKVNSSSIKDLWTHMKKKKNSLSQQLQKGHVIPGSTKHCWKAILKSKKTVC